MLKFGRRVIFDRQISNKELMESHLNTARLKQTSRKQNHFQKLHEDREWLDKTKQD